MRLLLAGGLACSAAALSLSAAVTQDRPAYRNPALLPDERARDLLGRMTLEEKFWQLYMSPGSLDDSTHDYSHGSFGLQVRMAEGTGRRPLLADSGSGAWARAHTERINAIQRYFVERTRLGIPVIPFEEALHGVLAEGATIFPQAIALAATWDTSLAQRVAESAALEARSRGIRQVLSPVVNIATDVRWGRVEETYGEDPFLSMNFGDAFVRAFESAGHEVVQLYIRDVLASVARPVQELRGFQHHELDIRDRAGVLHLASTAAPSADLGPLVSQVQGMRMATRQLSTQEQAWLLLAAHGLSSKAGAYRASIGGRAVAGTGKPATMRLDTAAIGPGVVVRNDGEGKLWLGASVVGIPARDLPAESRGFEIKRSYYTLDGKPADLARVRQSEVLVVLVRVTAKTDQYHQAMIVDLLPAGFEIENPRLERRKPEDMKWLPQELAEPRHVEPRDDRYVAAIEVGGKGRDFYLAYVVRAVTPGSFKLPAAYVEDMYAPAIFGRDAMGRVTVLPRS